MINKEYNLLLDIISWYSY